MTLLQLAGQTTQTARLAHVPIDHKRLLALGLGGTVRKLAAIFTADVAGYSRLMGQDEVGTLRRLTACRAILGESIAAHRGRIFGSAGDSVVADFASAVDPEREWYGSRFLTYMTS